MGILTLDNRDPSLAGISKASVNNTIPVHILTSEFRVQTLQDTRTELPSCFSSREHLSVAAQSQSSVFKLLLSKQHLHQLNTAV